MRVRTTQNPSVHHTFFPARRSLAQRLGRLLLMVYVQAPDRHTQKFGSRTWSQTQGAHPRDMPPPPQYVCPSLRLPDSSLRCTKFVSCAQSQNSSCPVHGYQYTRVHQRNQGRTERIWGADNNLSQRPTLRGGGVKIKLEGAGFRV